MSVSVIIPAYNASKFITETVESVKNQTYSDWELIIVNDGSSDNTLELISHLASLDKRIQLVDKPNGGVSSARNLGILESNGEYLAFLDADDCWEPNFLAESLELLINEEFGMTHSDVSVIDETGQPTGEIKSGKEGNVLNEILAWEGHVISPPSSVLVKRDVIKNVGMFDENLSNNADQDFYIRIAKAYLIGRIALPLVKYRIHSNNMHGNIEVLERDSIYVFRKALKNELFFSEKFKKECLANVYLILAVNFLFHKSDLLKFIKYILKSVYTNPPILKKIFNKIVY